MEAKHTPGPWEWTRTRYGEPKELVSRHPEGGGAYVISVENDITDYGLSISNTLEISDADERLIAAAPALYGALEPFGDIDGEGDEDFPDDTPVTVTFGRSTNYTLTLGDLRRARQALSLVEGK